jgi:hypothetical protein
MKSRRRIAFPKAYDHATVRVQQGFATRKMGLNGHFAQQQFSKAHVRFVP